MNEPETTVYAVDDDPSVLRGIERLLRSVGYKTELFTSTEAFLTEFRRDATGCVILDLAMPGIDGLQVQQRLTQRGSALPIIFLTGRGDIPTSVRAMKQGAADFLTKPVDDEQLLAAVRNALRGCATLFAEQLAAMDFEHRLATLTRREREVLNHLLCGAINKQIAASLGTVEKTIKFHRAHIMKKMGTPTLAVLAGRAARAARGSELAGFGPANPSS